MFNRIKNFYTDLQSEFRKVTWPTRQAVIKQTSVVLVLSIIMSIFLGSVDYGLGEIFKTIIQ